VQGVVISDHIKSAHWQTRKSEWIGQAPVEIVNQVRAKLKPLLGI
jgi:hypothetical protein